MLKILLPILLIFGCTVSAQEAGITLPPVTMDELSESMHPKDSSAVAAYKYRYGKTTFEYAGGRSWIMVTEVYTRLKVYKKAGFEYANAQIVYYSDTWRAKGAFSEAVTYNLVNGVVEKTALNKDSEFEEELDGDLIMKKIVMPGVKEGSVVDYKYTLRTPYISAINDWDFQFPIPMDDVRYDLLIPVNFTYRTYFTGSVPVRTSPDLPCFYNEKTKTYENFHSYSAKNVKALKNEQYVNNIEDHTSSLKHQLISVSLPHMSAKRMSFTWKELAMGICRSDRFGKELELSSYYRKDLDLVLKNVYTPKKRADSIYAFVRNRMNWDQYMGFLCKKGVAKAYSERTGNAAEINLMLVSMLRYIGLEAHPVLINTRSDSYTLFPTPYAYNYVIASAVIDGDLVLMDATSKYALPDLLPEYVLNGDSRLIKKEGDNMEIDLTPKTSSRELINIVAQIDAGGRVTGEARDLYQDHIAFGMRELLAKMQNADYVEKLEAGYKGTVISNYEISNEKDPSKVLTEKYDFANTMVADVMGDKIFFSPMLFFAKKESPFKSETRDFPIDFTYPVKQKHNISITLPEGYTVASIPEPASLVIDNIAAFKYIITVTNNTLQLSTTFDVNYPTVDKDYYPALKDFFRKMIDKQNEKVVLIKAVAKK